MKKSTLINQTHSDYNAMMVAMANAMNAIKSATDLINTMNPPSAGTVIINLNNMYSEIGNMNAAIARDYTEELEVLRKKVE